jgi:hypothetical protein
MQLRTRKHHQTRHSYSIRHVTKVSRRYRSLPQVKVTNQSASLCSQNVPTVVKNVDRSSVNIIPVKDKSLSNFTNNDIHNNHSNSVSLMNHLLFVLLRKGIPSFEYSSIFQIYQLSFIMQVYSQKLHAILFQSNEVVIKFISALPLCLLYQLHYTLQA